LVLLILIGCADRPETEKILFDFESDAELDRVHWSCHTLFSLSEKHATHCSRSLRMELYPSPYPGLAPILREQDWRPYKSLCFDIYNSQEEELEIAVRIDDRRDYPRYEERYTKAFEMVSGLNRIKIPLDSLITNGSKRKMNLQTIHRVLIFLDSPKEKTELYLDYMRLEM